MTTPEEQAAEVLAGVLYAMNGYGWYGRSLGDWDDPESTIGRNEDERDMWRRQASTLAPLLTERERAARAEALREAAGEIEAERVVGNDLLDSEIGRNIGYENAAAWLRERADTYAEGGERDE